MKRALKIVGIIVGILILIALVLPFVINVNSFRPRIESELTTALGRKVSVGNLVLSIWSGSLSADDIAIADDPTFSNSPFIRAKSLGVGVEVMPLIFSKTLHITDLTLTDPQVSLLRARSGRWNFSTIGKAAPQTNAAPVKQAAAPATDSRPPHDRAGVLVRAGEDLIEGGLDRVCQDEGAADHRDAQHDREAGQHRPELASQQPLDDCLGHRFLEAIAAQV